MRGILWRNMGMFVSVPWGVLGRRKARLEMMFVVSSEKKKKMLIWVRGQGVAVGVSRHEVLWKMEGEQRGKLQART